MHTYIHTHTFLHINTHTHITYECINTYKYTCTYMHASMDVHTYIMYVHMICMYIYMYVCMYVSIAFCTLWRKLVESLYNNFIQVKWRTFFYQVPIFGHHTCDLQSLNLGQCLNFQIVDLFRWEYEADIILLYLDIYDTLCFEVVLYYAYLIHA